MTPVNILHLKKSFGETDVLKDVSFHIPFGECIGIVGTNGSGKSTLLRILAGLEQADSGEIFQQKEMTVGYLKQNPTFIEHDARTLKEEFTAEEKKYLSILKMDSNRAESLHELSGGEKEKYFLCRLLALHPKLLLLDEPTNNLDAAGVKACIELLKTYQGTILVVSHDRYFLDNMVSGIIEIEDGRAFEYAGNYTDYREEKERIFYEKLHRYEESQKQKRRIEDAISQVKQWSDKAHRDSVKADSSGMKMGVKEKKRAKAKKMDKKIKNDKKRLEKMLTSGERRPIPEKNVYFKINGDANHGRRILLATDISKSFGMLHLFSHSNFSIARGEKIALYGANGCGKSTLIHLITGTEKLDSGEIWISPSSTPFVLEQTFAVLPQDKTLQEYLTDRVGQMTGTIRTTLYNMGIEAKHLNQKICTLSFGEQMKVKMAEPILMQKDFIILDEPTNHLDLHAREMLEQTLSEYEGTLLLVSHDLYFLRKICNKVLVFDKGQLQKLERSFADYMEMSEFVK